MIRVDVSRFVPVHENVLHFVHFVTLALHVIHLTLARVLNAELYALLPGI